MYKQWRAQILQEKALLGLLVVVLIVTLSLSAYNDFMYQRFFGQFDPVITVLSVLIFGYLSLVFFLKKFGFPVNTKGYRQLRSRDLGLVGLFVLISILVDWIMVFPRDINIQFPESLLFYPTIACFVEMLFHVLPLAFLFFLWSRTIRKTPSKTQFWLFILLVATLEPTFQVMMGDYPLWAIVVIWVNLFLFNVSQLVMFKNKGFIAMFCLRLMYYLGWHILWGFLRLEYLF